jgi:MinD-like ATPase involved in chromosome partitioning or flagellar assembly
VTSIAVFSVKGSPGATTTALALVAAITARDARSALLIEADSDGGDLAPLLGRPIDPGMASLAAASRHEATRLEIERHLQPLPAGGDALLGSTDPVEMAANLTTLAAGLSDVARSVGHETVLDAGRLSSTSAACGLVERADIAMLCLRESVPAIEAVAARREWLTALTGGRLGLVLLGDSYYGDVEITRATGLPVLGRLPLDGRAVPPLHGGPGLSPTRSHLVRAARTLHDTLITRGVGVHA